MRWIVSCAVTIAAITMASQAACASENFPSIVVTVAPLKPYVDAILRGQGEAQNLLRPGQEPHDFALTVPQGQMLAKADIVIVPDLSLSPLLQRLLAKNPRVRVIELSKLDGADPLPYDKTNPWFDAMKEPSAPSSNQQHWWRKQNPKDVTKSKEAPAYRIWPTDGSKPVQPKPVEFVTVDGGKKDAAAEAKKDEPPKYDPHLWLDPSRMAAIAVPLAEAITENYPAARTELVANARAEATHLRREVIPPLREMLSKPETSINAVGRKQLSFITYHAAYQYFLESFRLTHHGEITPKPDAKLGAATIAKMINGAQGMRIRCIIGEEQNSLVNRLASITSARVVLLSPEQIPERNSVDYHEWLHDDYDRFLYVTAKTISGCL